MAAKTSLLKRIALFQTLSRLFQFAENVKCRRISLELIYWAPHSSLGRERKIRRRLFTSSIKRGIRHFQIVDVRWGQRYVQKGWCTCKVFVLLIKPITFSPFTLPSSLSLLKLPKNKATVVDGINSPCSFFFLTALTPEPEHMHQACSSSCRGILWRTWSPGY